MAVLTYDTLVAGSPRAATSRAQYYRSTADGVLRAGYYGAPCAGILRPDLTPEELADLAINPAEPLTEKQTARLFEGLNAAGERIPGKHYSTYREWTDEKGIRHESVPLAAVDLTFNLPKSVSIAYVEAPTEFEREVIYNAAWIAALKTIDHIETQIGLRRSQDTQGHTFSAEQGRLVWVAYPHTASRPTIHLPFVENGLPATELLTMREAAGDMHLHFHFLVLNYIRTQSGKVGSVNLSNLKGGLKEWGAIFDAYLGTELRAVGIEYEFDQRTKCSGRIPSIPESVCRHFSKATGNGEKAARAYAKSQGLDWDAMEPEQQKRFVKRAIQDRRQHKTADEKRVFGRDGLGDNERWKKQFEEIGYKHRSVLRPGTEQGLRSEEERIAVARRVSLDLLAEEFRRRAVVEACAPRIAAARGLIEAGIAHPSDVDKVTTTYRTHDVLHDGELVPLIYGRVPETGRLGITTGLHASREEEFIRLAKAAYENTTAVIPPDVLARAVHESRLDFSDEHGKKQLAIVERIAGGSRLTVVIGVAGAGKTALLLPPVASWKAEGRRVYGLGLANRHAKRLCETGIADHDAVSIHKFLNGVHGGSLIPEQNGVLVIDEISTVGTRQMLELLRIREQFGLQIVALGDDKQTLSLEAGPIIDLVRHAVGEENVPEILTTLRQKRKRDRETSLMFREGRAAEALARKIEDGTVLVVPGGREHAIRATVKLWEERRSALTASQEEQNGAGLSTIPLALSAPTNLDAREIGSAIRDRRRELGEIGPDFRIVPAVDQQGAEYDLPLAVGDSVRLFGVLWIPGEGGRKQKFGYNGAVAEVRGHRDESVLLRDQEGIERLVPWDALRAEGSQRISLTYGDVISLDARTGDTAQEHIMVMASGSAQVNSNKAYVGMSRDKYKAWLIISDGEERREIMARRGFGHPKTPPTYEDVVNNVARNLSHPPRKISATELIDTAHDLRHGRGLSNRYSHKHKAAPNRQPNKPWVEPSKPAPQTEVRETGKLLDEAKKERRSMRDAAAKPKAKKERKAVVVSEAESVAEFAAAAERMGLRIKGQPIMDGKIHRVPVDGDRNSKKSGAYIGHMDGLPAGYIRNHKTNDELRWRAKGGTRELSEEERAKERARIAAMRAERERQDARNSEEAAKRARSIWRAAQPATPTHPYLAAKGIGAHGVRVSKTGDLLVPLRDADGKMWSIQTVTQDGQKLYMKGGNRRGTHALLGAVSPGTPLVIGEGYATMATIREATSLPVVAALDSGNLERTAAAYRERYPDLKIIIAADNDHHLPRRKEPLPNAGIESAQAAADAVEGHVVVPEFSSSDPGTDWNDFKKQHGEEAMRAAFGEALKAAGIEVHLEPLDVRAAAQAERAADRRQSSTKLADRTSSSEAAQRRRTSTSGREVTL